MEKEIKKLGIEAANAVAELKSLQKAFMAGKVSYDDIQALGKPLIKVFNAYAKALAQKRGMPYKPISLGYFLR